MAKSPCIPVVAWLLPVYIVLLVFFILVDGTEWRAQRDNRFLDTVKVFLACFAKQGIVPVLVAGHQWKYFYMVCIDVHGFRYSLELLHELTSGMVVVKAQIMIDARRDGKHSTNLHIGGSATRGDEHAFLGEGRVVPKAIPVYLVESHCIVGTFKPRDTAHFLQRLAAEIGYPQALAAVAALGFTFIASATVHPWTTAFLQAYNLARLFGQYQREGKVGIRQSVRPVFGRQEEMVGKSPLCEDVDATVLEIGIKTLVGLPVFHVKTVDVVIIQPERGVLPSGLDDAQKSVIDGLVQQPVADKVDQPVGRDIASILRELLRECLDKGYDIIELLPWRLETAFAVRRDDELVTPDACAIVVRAGIGRVTRAVTFVQVIARVHQYILNVQPLQEVIVCQFSICHINMLFSVFCCITLKSSAHLSDLTVHLCFKIPCGHIHR